MIRVARKLSTLQNYSRISIPILNPNYKFMVLSDLHLESNNEINHINSFIPESDENRETKLILAGDIGNPKSKKYWDFLKSCATNYESVYFVNGNHEYWQKDGILSMAETEKLVELRSKEIADNLHFLNKTSKLLDPDTLIIGATLWSHIPDLYKGYVHRIMGDYSYIYKTDKSLIVPDDTCDINKDHTDWIFDTVKKNKTKNCVIVTHHLPIFDLVADSYKGHFSRYAFTNFFENDIKNNDNIKLWICGHSHQKKIIQKDNCTFILNPVPTYKKYLQQTNN
jgi:predicted phosphodiesterase